jgi:hypothetical protein
MHVDANNNIHDVSEGAMECPHCRTHSHMTLSATPNFAALHTGKPAMVGMVYQCDSCQAPVFMRYRVKSISEERVDLHAIPQEVEKPQERFSYAYIPDAVAINFRDALGCYRNGLMQAFAAMCRLTAQTIFDEKGEAGKLKIFNEVGEIARVAELDDATTNDLRSIIFSTDSDSLRFPDGLDRATAAILLEIMKDMLHQTYVRYGRLQKALKMRRLFADQDYEYESSKDPKIASLNQNRPTGTG